MNPLIEKAARDAALNICQTDIRRGEAERTEQCILLHFGKIAAALETASENLAIAKKHFSGGRHDSAETYVDQAIAALEGKS